MFKSAMRDIVKGILDIVYPRTCLSCKTRLKDKVSIDNVVCGTCWSKIKKNLPPFCSCCGRHLEKKNITKNICPSCARKQLHFDRAFTSCAYEGVMKELIREFKYNGKDHLGSTLSRPMLQFIKEYNVPVDYLDLIIPVPLHKSRLREREFNQAGILGSHIAKGCNKIMLDDILIRHRNTRTQTELEPGERLLNVKGGFSVTHDAPLKGKNILLVDDVMTTGVTCSEAAYTLKDAGANIVFVLTLAN